MHTDLRRWIDLTEGVVAPYTGAGPLWHGTDLLGLAAILGADYLAKSIDTDNPAGASLTTNENMAWSFADRSSYIFEGNHFDHLPKDWPHGKTPLTGAVLEFDAGRLRQHYKLVSYVDQDNDDEEEVRVLGDRIAPVSDYLIGFRFVPQDAPWFAAYLRLPYTRLDWHDPEAMADFLLNLHRSPLFHPA